MVGLWPASAEFDAANATAKRSAFTVTVLMILWAACIAIRIVFYDWATSD
jgi:hypothetical protein